MAAFEELESLRVSQKQSQTALKNTRTLVLCGSFRPNRAEGADF